MIDSTVVDALMNFFKPKKEDVAPVNATPTNVPIDNQQFPLSPASPSAGKTDSDLTIRLQDSPQLIVQNLGSPQSVQDPIGDLIKQIDKPQVKTATVTAPTKPTLGQQLSASFTDDVLKKYKEAYDVSDTNAGVVSPLLTASKLTGVDPDILFKIAKAESKFDPNAKNTNSTATGLFQIIKQTWNGLTPELQKLYGSKGFVNNRKDPLSNAIGGAHYIGQIKDQLTGVRKSGDVTARDIYLGLFSGPGRAKQVISALEAGKGNKPANTVYPLDTMKRNKTIFYDDKGQMRNLQDVYNRLTDKVA